MDSLSCRPHLPSDEGSERQAPPRPLFDSSRELKTIPNRSVKQIEFALKHHQRAHTTAQHLTRGRAKKPKATGAERPVGRVTLFPCPAHPLSLSLWHRRRADVAAASHCRWLGLKIVVHIGVRRNVSSSRNWRQRARQ